MSNCQKDVKYQKLNMWIMEEVHKKEIDIYNIGGPIFYDRVVIYFTK